MIYKEYKEIFDKNVMIVEANDKTLKLSNGYYIVSKQIGECCEINYLDFAAVMDTVLIGQPIKYLHIEISKNLLGIRINKEFIPAYSLQNGYYGACFTPTFVQCFVHYRIVKGFRHYC